MKKALVLVLAISIALLGGCSKKKEEVKQRMWVTFITGQDILNAVQKYHDDNSKFPDTLDELTPKYLPEIIPPVLGNGQWKYELVDDGQRAKLMIEGKKSGDQRWWRCTGDQTWSTDPH